jgi:D-glycero-D-manno-heptose 1,7-bisphosphate phosphatase
MVDRDGTLCEEVGYLNNSAHLKILPKVAEGIRLLNSLNVAVVVVTNQPVVGHNLLTIPKLKEINLELAKMLEKKGAIIDAMYSCPHHPEAPNPKYKLNCRCRKPNTLLYKHAVADFGRKKVLGNYDVTADFVCKNFLECVKTIIQK